MDASSFKITANINKLLGYNDEYCVKCTNGDNNYPRQSISYNKFRITLPNVCVTSMKAKKEFTKDYTVDYSSASDKHSLSTNAAAEYFTNTENAKCGVKKCTLLTTDGSGECTSTTYSGSDFTQTMAGLLEAKNNNADGYNGKFCIKCENEHGSAINGPIAVT